jgi:undecaprenyl-phosphate 4-deoxy-4-formamido-L-arabinose transferase
MFGVGLLGEYVGRIYNQVRERPRYVVRAVLERDPDEAPDELPGAPMPAVVDGIRNVR